MHSLKYRLNLVNYRTIPRTTAVVEVVKDDLSHHYKWRSDSPLDARFDLTSMIGNVNGRFKWGQSAFEVSSRDLEIKQEQVSKADNTYANFLHGELRNLRGYWTKDRINLDEKLGINEYVDQGSGETYHRLMVNEETLNRADKRQLVLCFDGTSNKFGAIGNTNVVKLVQLLKKGNLSQQMVYYQTGIGTYAPPGWTNRISLAIAKKADEAVAWYLDQHVMDGYRFLVQSYREQIPFAFEVYKGAKDAHHPDYSENQAGRDDTKYAPGEVNPQQFKRTFCFDVKVDFVGVWDTVASVGGIWPQTLPWIDYNPSVRVFRQALALDEHRGHFIPSVWDHRKTKPNQDIREVWFRGEHSDIGGGVASPPLISEVTTHSDVGGGVAPPPLSEVMVSCSSGMLSNIPLRWMIRQTFNSQTGILFDYQVVEGYRKAKVLEKPAENTNQKFMWNKRIEASNELDNEDLKGKPRDIFGSNPFWNLLEMMPFLKPKPHIGKGSGGTAMGWPNMWNGRAIYLPNEKAPIFLHSSVVHYINSKAQSPANGGVVGATATKQYWPKARWIGYEEKWPQVEDLYYEKTEVNSDDFLKETKTVLNMEHLPPVQSQPNGGRSQWFRFLFGK